MSRELNILMISHHRRYRITTRQHPIAKNLVDRGHHVTIITTANTRRIGFQEFEWDGINIIETPDMLWGRLRSGWDLWSILGRILYLNHKDFSFDILHCFGSRPATIYPALSFRKHHSLPILIDWIDWIGRGGLLTVKRPIWYRHLFGGIETYYEEAFLTRASGVTVISNALFERALKLGVQFDRILHLPGGTLPDLFKMRGIQECRKYVGLENTGPIIGFSSSDSHLDLEIIMAALAIVSKSFPNIKLLITGKTGPLVHKLARKYHVEQRLILTGFLDFKELPWHLGCADLFVLPFPDTVYNRGRWPNKVCDYISLGRPIVSNPCGDIESLFLKHNIGLLADWDEHDFANKITQLLENPDLSYRLGNQARKISTQEYSWSSLVEKLEKFYVNIFSRNCNNQEGFNHGR